MKTKFIKSLASICCVILFSSFAGRDPKWFERRMGELEKTILIQNEKEKIEGLGKFLGVGFHGGMDDEQQRIFDRAQSALLSIPGHAKYYQGRIEEMRVRALADARLSLEEEARRQQEGNPVIYMGEYDSFRERCFGVLGMLPSSETVSVLGHYLDDTAGRDGKDLLGRLIPVPSDYTDFRPNAEYAAQAIRKLGIEQPPFKEPHENPYDAVFDGETDAWKNWWNEVKHGKRTYRFIGSNIEYGPDGPAGKEAIEQARQNMKRNEERASGRRKAIPDAESANVSGAAPNPFFIVAMLAACALVAVAAWHLLRKRKSN